MLGKGNDDVLDLNFDNRFDFAKKYPREVEKDDKNVISWTEIEDNAKIIDNDVEENWNDNLTHRKHHEKTYPVYAGTSIFSENKNLEKEVDKKTEGKKADVTDYEGHWAKEFIEKVLDKDLMDLINGKFFPDRKATRFELVKALAKMQNVNPKEYTENIYKDLNKDSEESGYIVWASKKGIVYGLSLIHISEPTRPY